MVNKIFSLVELRILLINIRLSYCEKESLTQKHLQLKESVSLKY